MSPEWVTAIAIAGTFVVIAASAAAPLVQVRCAGADPGHALVEKMEVVKQDG